METLDRKEELSRRAQLVRLAEAFCGIAHPTQNDLITRDGISRALVQEFGLKVTKVPSPIAESGRRGDA